MIICIPIVSTVYKWDCTKIFPLPRERQEIKQFYLEFEHRPQFFFSGIQVCFLIYILHKKYKYVIQICFLDYKLQRSYKYVFLITICKKTYKYVFTITICKKHTNMFSQLQFAKKHTNMFFFFQFALSPMGICPSRHSAICPFLVTFLLS